jgi:hypothetical protein
MATLPDTVTQMPDPMQALQQSNKKIADTQAEGTAAEAAIRGREQAATAPVQERRTQAGKDVSGMLAKGPEQVPLPKNEAMHIDPKQMSDMAGLMMALAGLAGSMTRSPLTASLRGMTGAMQGVKAADEQQFNRGYQEYKDNLNAAINTNNEKLKEYDRVLKGKEFNLREMDAELTRIAKQYGDEVTLNAKSYKDRIEAITSQRTATQKIIEHKDNIDQHVEDRKQRAAQHAETMSLAHQKASGGGDGAAFTPEDLKFLAQQRLAGDKTVFQNLGRGAQGAKNVIALRHAVMEEAKAQGKGPQELAMLDAEFGGIQAGERTLGTRTANVGMAVNEAEKFIDIAKDASDKVDRTKYPSLNSLILAAENGTGDENVVRFAAANNSLLNAYARAISPTGTPTVSDKDHAREILTTAYSKGQYKAATDLMHQEMVAAKSSPGSTKDELRQLRGVGGGKTGEGKAPSSAIEHLKAHPELKDAFKAKYGYLPEGM